MSAEYTCDGCGKKARAVYWGVSVDWHKPNKWFQRGDKDSGPEDACSRACIDRIAKKTGKNRLIMPG